MKPTTHNCEECQFREWVGDSGLRCLKAHKPRFYGPRRNERFDEGWRRRCADFVVGEHVQRVCVSKGGEG